MDTAANTGYSGHAETGAKYDGTYCRAADIAKGIRADIKTEVAKGNLPGKTHRLGPFKYSVRSQSFAGGQSVSINVIGPAEDGSRSHSQWAFRPVDDRQEDAQARDYQMNQVFTDEAKRIGALLNSLGNAYTYRDIDTQSDYFHVTCWINVYCGTGGLCM